MTSDVVKVKPTNSLIITFAMLDPLQKILYRKLTVNNVGVIYFLEAVLYCLNFESLKTIKLNYIYFCTQQNTSLGNQTRS